LFFVFYFHRFIHELLFLQVLPFIQANKIGKINLAATGKDLMEDEKQGDVTVDLFAALDMESEAVTERLPELENNQTLGLLNGFLSVDDWYHANILFERLAPLNPVAHDQICSGLFRLVSNPLAQTILHQIYSGFISLHLQLYVSKEILQLWPLIYDDNNDFFGLCFQAYREVNHSFLSHCSSDTFSKFFFCEHS
jgi:hypothetical protein